MPLGDADLLVDAERRTRALPGGHEMGNTLMPNQRLDLNERLTSRNRQFELVMQTDGNLVLYRVVNQHPIWSTGTTGQDISHAVMQTDGNFVLYTFGGPPAWSTNTANRQYSWLKLLDTGGLAIIHPQLSWSTRCFLGPPPEDLQYYLPEQD
jgi:hypothetical protein